MRRDRRERPRRGGRERDNGAPRKTLRLATGVPLRRSNFNKMSAWHYAVRSIGAEGLHVHDLRHTGTFAATGGAGIKDLMARMGHDSERAAMIYQHEARGTDQTITSAIDDHIAAERDQDEDDDGQAGALVRQANCTLIARKIN